MKRHRPFTLLTLGLAGLLLAAPDAAAQRGRGSSRPSVSRPSTSRPSPSRGNSSRGVTQRPSVSRPSPSRSSGSRSTPTIIRTSPTRGTSGSTQVRTGPRTVTTPGGTTVPTTDRTPSASTSGPTVRYTPARVRGSTEVASPPSTVTAPVGSDGRPATPSTGPVIPGRYGSTPDTSGDTGSWNRPPDSTGTVRTRHVPFPRMATDSSRTRADVPQVRGAPSRLSGSSPSGAPYVRSTSGPSISRLRSDRGRDTTPLGPGSRSRGEGAAITPGIPSSRTIDRAAILERYGSHLPHTGAADIVPGGRGVDRGPGSLRTPPGRAGDDRSRGRDSLGGVPLRGAAIERTPSRGRTDATPPRSYRGPDDLERRARERTAPLRDLTSVDPQRADRIRHVGDRISRASGVSVNVGLNLSLGCTLGYYPWSLGWGYWDNGFYVGAGYGSCGYPYWWGCGAYSYSPFCHPWAWPYYWWYRSWPYRIGSWCHSYPTPYYYSAPVYYSTVVTRYVTEPTTYYVESQPAVVQQAPAAEQQPVGEAVAEPVTSPPAPSAAENEAATRASGQYLTLGDQAFREQRYADAVHFYAKAVEFSPDEGTLFLVLADGLFATGDYHYGAYALRRALELDPSLASSEVDKHEFYAEAVEFDRQLAVLEGFVADHPGDGDARLLLAANYLFGGRPAASVDLLEDPASRELVAQDAGALLLAAGRSRQYGQPAAK